MTTKDVSSIRIAPKVWRNGEFIDWDNARVHVMTHAIHYGSSVFEGIRAYQTESGGPAIFRLTEHMQRLLNSGKIYRMNSPFTRAQFCQAAVDLVGDSGLDECYLRPIMFRGLDEANPAFGFTSQSKTSTGWTVGAGVEFALVQNWTAKVEYLYMDLGDFNTNVSAPLPTKVDFTANIVRAGVNFRF